MRRFRISGRRLHVLMALLFILTNFASPAALSANQDTPPEVGVLITSFSCINDPGNASLTAGTMPSDCAPVAGVVMSVTSDIDGEVSGTTGQNGAAEVTVSLGSTITVWQDQTLLSGTTPRMNPITVSVLDYTEVTFVSLPVATVAPEPTTAPDPTVAPTEVVEQPTAPVVEPPAPTADTTQQQDTAAQPSSRTMQTTQTEKPYQPDPNKDEPPTTEATETATSEATETATSEATETATTEVTQTPTSEATVTPTTPPTVTPTATTAPTQAPTPTPTKPPAPTPTPTPAPVTKTFATVSNTGGVGLRCRAEPNTSATIITVLPEGTKVETRGAASNSWIPVKCANQNGWIYAGYAKTSTETTSPTSPTTPPSGTTGTATVSNTGGAGLRCRASASTSAAIITVLPEGTKVETRGATSNGWIPVKCAGQNGYIYASYATVNTTANPTPTPAPTTPPVSGTAGWGTVKNTGGGGLNCRTSASLSASVITVLAEGSTVETRGATSNGWVPVKCAGQDGWVYSSYFVVSTSGTAPKPTPTPAPSTGTGEYAMVSGTGYGGLNCRTSASLSASVITILPEGTRVETRGSASNGWLPVKCAGQNGWVSTSYVLMGVGAGSGTGAVWIEVDLTRQYMRVYRGDTVIGETYVSTGRYGFDTPPGTFYINWKLPSQTMTGVLGGEYYYVEDVPWVMYFTDRGHAIHGAYWHNNFGYRMSHGCVNLPVGFSKWLYEISPVGTRVWIHY